LTNRVVLNKTPGRPKDNNTTVCGLNSSELRDTTITHANTHVVDPVVTDDTITAAQADAVRPVVEDIDPTWSNFVHLDCSVGTVLELACMNIGSLYQTHQFNAPSAGNNYSLVHRTHVA
jgi:hypothetical protein